MYTWTYVHSYEGHVIWTYVFDTNDEKKVAKYIRKNVEYFWDKYFSVCVKYITTSGGYENEGPLFACLKSYIKSRKHEIRTSKSKYIERIEYFLSEMTTDEILESMSFETFDNGHGTYRLGFDKDAELIEFK